MSDTKTNPTTAAPGSLRELWPVALPLVISSGSNTAMYVFDRYLLSHFAEESLAAVLPAGMVNWTILMMGIASVAYVNAFISQYEGAQRKDRVGEILWQAVYLALLLGGLLLCFAPKLSYVFDWFGHDPAVVAQEKAYFEILCLGGAPLMLSAALQGFFSGRGENRVIMTISIVQSVICMVLDYLLIFGKVPGAPDGIRGAATAHALACWFAALLYVGVIVWGKYPEYHLWKNARPRLDLVWRLIRFGVPAGVQSLIDVTCFTLFLLMFGKYSTDVQAATTLAFNYNGMVFVPMIGMGTAVTTLVGRRIGEGKPDVAEKTTWSAFRLTTIWVLAWAVLFVGAPRIALTPYSDGAHAGLVETTVPLLSFVAVYSMFDAMTIIFGSATRGAGDTRFAMLWSLFGGVCLIVLPTWWLTQHATEYSYYWPWAVTTMATILIGVGFGLRFWQGKWKAMRVIDQPGELPA
jgi:MATE family multidrug resistance protein